MADIDRVLKAEETIKDIATELGRMKSAADLMDSAQTKIDAVIKATSDIITKTGEFVKEGTQIVERIGDYDIQGDLGTIIEKAEGLTGKLDTFSKDTEKRDTNLLEGLTGKLDTFSNDTEKRDTNLLERLSVAVNNTSTLGRIILGIIGLNTLMSIVVLVRQFGIL